MFEYATRIEQIEEQLLKSMARSLNLEEDCFLKQCGQFKRLAAQFNYYPPCPRPDCVLGLKPHADATTVTILLQDEEVEGLQVMKDDKWFRVPIIPCALLVNVGDQIEVHIHTVTSTFRQGNSKRDGIDSISKALPRIFG